MGENNKDIIEQANPEVEEEVEETEEVETESKSECTIFDYIKLVIGILIIAALIFYCGFTIGKTIGYNNAKLDRDVVERAITDYFNPAEAEVLIDRLKDYQAVVTEYSLFSTAKIQICVDHSRSNHSGEVGDSDCYLELKYNYHTDKWEITICNWVGRTCVCGCDECICIGGVV